MNKTVRLYLSAEPVPGAVITAAFPIGEAEVTLGQTLFAGSISKSLQYAVETFAAPTEDGSGARFAHFSARIVSKSCDHETNEEDEEATHGND